MDGSRSGSFGRHRPYGEPDFHLPMKRSGPQLDNERSKKLNVSGDSQVVDTIYRILCPLNKVGNVLGKGGSIVNSIREETHAKIRVADAAPGAEERVIIIFSYPQSETHKTENTENETDGSDLMKSYCPAQAALLKVHDRILADEYVRGGVIRENNEADDEVTARLLVPTNQVGCLLGKGGTVIQKLRTDTKANIRIVAAEHLPSCAMKSDELVQISGAPDLVKRALYEISTRLHQHPRKDSPSLDEIVAASTGAYKTSSFIDQPHDKYDYRVNPPMPAFRGYEQDYSGSLPGRFSGRRTGNDGEITEEFSMRVLCPANKIGFVIGKGGASVRQLEQQTGARIQVEDGSPESEMRIIQVSSKEVPWEPVSPTIDAVLQLQEKVSEMSEKGDLTTKLLVPANKVGCLLGQGGHIINEMRRRTRADIRVYAKDDKPNYASSNDELVQISGNERFARDALSEIASRLRDRTLEGKNVPMKQTSGGSQRIPPYESYSVNNLTPGGMRPQAYGGYERQDFKDDGFKYGSQGYTGRYAASGYSDYTSSIDYRGPNSVMPSMTGDDTGSYSDLRQNSGARPKSHEPLPSYSDYGAGYRGSYEQSVAARGYMRPPAVATDGHNLQPLSRPWQY